jgi:hypothetical protein
MVANEPVKEGAPAFLNALRGVLQDPAQHRANKGFGVASGHLQVKRQPLGITEPFRQFLCQGLLPALGLKPVISHSASVVGRTNRVAMIVSTSYQSYSSRSIGLAIRAPARLCLDDALLRQAFASRLGVEAFMTLLHPEDQLVAQPLKKNFDRQLQEVA